MPLKLLLRSSFLKLRQTSPVDAWVERHGPAVRRVPQILRVRTVTQNRIAALPQARVWRFGPAEDVRPHLPGPEAGPKISVPPLSLRPRRLPPPFVAQLERAWLVGRHATPFTPEGAMLLTPFLDRLPDVGMDTHADLVRWASEEGWKRQPRAAEGEWSGETVCSLVGRFDLNFFHWMVDICSQLEALPIYRERTGIEPRILIRAQSPPFVRQSLRIFGFDPAQLLEWPLPWAPGQDASAPNEPTARLVRRLVVPSARGHSMARSALSLRWLQSTLAQFCGVDLGAGQDAPRLYIYRAPGNWRTIRNDDEVREFLQARGFEVVRPERMELADQVRLFARASVVVGVHGAGMTNILFAPHADVVEIIGSYGGADYFLMAQALGNRFRRVLGVEDEGGGGNITVNLRKLGDALESLGAHA